MTTNIEALRKAKGWSQRDLAARLGVSRQTVSNIENGRADPNLRLALRFAWTFGRSVEDVFHVDLEQKMEAIGASWARADRLAGALEDVNVLDEMGRDGWELVGFGSGTLRFRRPEDPGLRLKWAYRRLEGRVSKAAREAIEAEGWQFCGKWLSTYHYFKTILAP